MNAEQLWKLLPDAAQRRTSVENVADVLNALAKQPAAAPWRGACEHTTANTACRICREKHGEDFDRRSAPSPADERATWADEIIDALQGSFDTEGITENDSGDALIRLSSAIAAVEEVAESRSPAMAAQPDKVKA